MKQYQVLKPTVPDMTLRRIPRYHQILSDLERRGVPYVSSRYLATFCRIDATQVRKDVSIIGYKGKPREGYSVAGLREAIAEFLGINFENTAIVVGAGKLGSALAEYPGFAEYGLKIVALFDTDPAKIGSPVGTFTVLPLESLPRVLHSYEVGIAVITVPPDAAQAVCDRVVSLGIRAIWNFAPVELSLPEEVVIRSENIATGLAILSHRVHAAKESSGR